MKNLHKTVSDTVPYLLANSVVALVAIGFHLSDLVPRLGYLDSTWYSHIAQMGYIPIPGNGNNSAVWAFFPAWPMVLRVLSRVIGESLPIQLVGSITATLLFVLTASLIQRRQNQGTQQGLVPKTRLGMWLFLFSPGAWVFMTNHTEALFLLLSWGALATKDETVSDTISWNAVSCSVLAGLAALTRNQGVLVAVCTAFALASVPRGLALKTRLWRFACSGAISVSIFAVWPAYQWWLTGNPMASMKAQENWPHNETLKGYLDAMIWVSDRNFHHVLVFWLVIAVGIALLRKSPSQRPLGLYCILSALLWPIQGINFPSAYRFSAVLFPVWFVAGDWISGKLDRVSSPKQQMAVGFVILTMTTWALHTSWYYYSQIEWPY